MRTKCHRNTLVSEFAIHFSDISYLVLGNPQALVCAALWVIRRTLIRYEFDRVNVHEISLSMVSIMIDATSVSHRSVKSKGWNS